MNTPVKALDALATPGQVTLGQVALLEKIGSPLLKEGKLEAADVIPSLYLLSLPAKEGVKHLEHLQDDAFDWADALDNARYAQLLTEAIAAIQAFFGMLPQAEVDAPKKASPATAG